MCVDVSLENRCKRAQMANFLLARAETGARGKESLLAGEARDKKRTIFVDRKNRD